MLYSRLSWVSSHEHAPKLQGYSTKKITFSNLNETWPILKPLLSSTHNYTPKPLNHLYRATKQQKLYIHLHHLQTRLRLVFLWIIERDILASKIKDDVVAEKRRVRYGVDVLYQPRGEGLRRWHYRRWRDPHVDGRRWAMLGASDVAVMSVPTDSLSVLPSSVAAVRLRHQHL